MQITLPKYWKRILAGIFLSGILVFLGLLKFSTSPTFCHSCHIMKPYYDSWAKSKHNKVSCVYCHYPPTEEMDLLWRKFQALSQVVKYVTRTYSSKPYAEVDDSACLRKGCHSTRLLEGKVEFGKGIKFDHTPHLTEIRRGRKLRCVSCHSQMVQGRHLEVTLDTCYLCHFKGMKSDRKISPLGGCTGCHKAPDSEFKIGNITYTHKDFIARHGVDCMDCHLDVVQGDGEAPKDRCFTCHNQPEKLERYSDIPFIHENHITKHHIACFHCHKEIKHEIKSTKTVTALDCNTCHTSKHGGEQMMYSGNGARMTHDMPSPMFLANVDCIACHMVENSVKEELEFHGSTYRASEVGCIKCHGMPFQGMVDKWKAELEKALKSVSSRLSEAKAIFVLISKDDPDYRHVQHILEDAEHDYNFVNSSHGVHNIYYSAQILGAIDGSLDSFEASTKKKLPLKEPSDLLDGNFCAKLCHTQLGIKPPAEVKYNGNTIPHSQHTDLGLACNFCHTIGEHKNIKLKEGLDPSKIEQCKTCH